ncbi:hypothetical protein [Planomonospora venezuelensis]|uniref:Uncharacterized protein n=1 Tax=Planomonospora venezuelensis TaxID=1999 RepID=A0A841CYL7_PLAVE|nr:hypothetical protein [Planomonospora venezuelensis]MBB5963472.1 hypothetical protein [Planomonospora venezuelensis]GIN02196.1 hypothetical protein Pve01_38540 [Planomonospora venezuelensis]
MALIDRECVRKLLEAPDPDATLVFVRGDCVVLPDKEIDDAHRGLVIASRRELTRLLPGGDTLTEQQLDMLADRLDNVVRDLGA